MLRFAKNILLLLVFAAAVPSASAFSLFGPLNTSWMIVPDRGYVTAGGPMNLGEGYRWNMPTVTYGFDPAFVEYFGSNGVYAIEQAIKVLNDLPSASQVDLNKYPLSTTRENYRASALNLVDLKSIALSYMLNFMGLDTPEYYVWTVRYEYHVPNSNPVIPIYYVVQRNFDPVTFEPSSYINGTLYTYSLFHSDSPHFAFTTPAPVDTSLPAAVTVAAFNAFSGAYYTGLTRDDVGGLRYLYRQRNMVVETLPNNLTNSGLPFFSGSSGGSPWVPITVTNNAATNATGTNLSTFVNAALRVGVEKVSFQRVNFDMLLGQFIGSSNAFIDTFYLNGSAQQQSLIRVITTPDILFTAGDNGFVNDAPVYVWYSGSTTFTNNASLNGYTSTASVRDGPGTITPPLYVSFTKVGRFFRNVNPTTEAGSNPLFFWGSFDGSTNEPIVYPNGTSLRSVERQVFGY